MSETSRTFGIADYEFRLVFGRTKIDYDHNKDEKNRSKHGYSLESAVFLLERLLLPISHSIPYAVSDPFTENGEVRHMHLTLDDTGHVVHMVTTMRPDETVRVISLRRAHRNERKRLSQLTGFIEP